MIKELVAASAKTSTNATKSITSLTQPTSLTKPADEPRIHEACKRTIARQEQTIKEQAERIKRLEAFTGNLSKESMTCFQKYEDARFNYGEEKKKNEAFENEIKRLSKPLKRRGPSL